MKTQKDFLILSCLIILMIISSCGQNTTKIITSQSPITSTNSVFPTQTRALTSTPSLTPVPTLSTDDANMRLFELLETNGNCKLPCLWGIAPIKSLFQDAVAILIPLNILSDSVHLNSPDVGDISPRYRDGNFEIYTRVAFLTNLDSETINSISFRAEAHKRLVDESGNDLGYENLFDSKFFSEKINTYMLPHILSEQGVPELVQIHTSGGPLTRGGIGGFEIVLLYPNQGVFIHYETQMYIIGRNVQGCFQSPLIWIELFPSGNTDNFFAELEKTNWSFFKGGFKPLEETTSMSIDEFYETFSKSTEKCIETPKELWPIPEP